MREQGLQNLVDFMVEDIMTMTDAEILAEATPEELAAAQEMQAAFAKQIDAALTETMLGGRKPRQTALRARGRGFETVELDDAGNIIEPLRCICGGAIYHMNPKCPFYCLTT